MAGFTGTMFQTYLERRSGYQCPREKKSSRPRHVIVQRRAAQEAHYLSVPADRGSCRRERSPCPRAGPSFAARRTIGADLDASEPGSAIELVSPRARRPADIGMPAGCFALTPKRRRCRKGRSLSTRHGRDGHRPPEASGRSKRRMLSLTILKPHMRHHDPPFMDDRARR